MNEENKFDFYCCYFLKEGRRFQNVVFNQTINLVDVDEGFDAETYVFVSLNISKKKEQYDFDFSFFLYIFLGAVIVLVGFVSYQYLLSARVKRVAGRQSSQNVQGNQQTKGNYDPAWIPAHHLTQSKMIQNQTMTIYMLFLFVFRSFSSKKSWSKEISTS